MCQVSPCSSQLVQRCWQYYLHFQSPSKLCPELLPLQVSGPCPIKWESLPLPLYLLHNNVEFPSFLLFEKGGQEKQEIALVSKSPESPPHRIFSYKKKINSSPFCTYMERYVLPPKHHSLDRGQNTFHLLANISSLLLLLPHFLILSYSTLQISIVLNLLLFFILKRWHCPKSQK